MSTTGDEAERSDAEITSDPVVAAVGAVDDGNHHGQDGGENTLTAGEAQRSVSNDAVQSAPVLSQNNAPDADKAAGIVAQTRQDVAHLGRDRVIQVLRQRLEQAGVDLSDAEVDELARRVLQG